MTTAYTKIFEYTDGMTYKDLRYATRVRSLKEMLTTYQAMPAASTERQLNYALQNFALLLAKTDEDKSPVGSARRTEGLLLIQEIKLGMQAAMPKRTPVQALAPAAIPEVKK